MELAHSPHQPRPDTPLQLLSAQMELAHSPHQPRPDTPLQLLSAHTALSKGGESAHRRQTSKRNEPILHSHNVADGISPFPISATSRHAVAASIRTHHAVKRRKKRPPAHAKLSKGGESAHRRTQNRLHEAACFAIVCFMKMNAPERNSFFRDQNERKTGCTRQPVSRLCVL